MSNEIRDELRAYTPEEQAIANARAGKGMTILLLGFVGAVVFVYLALTSL